MLRPDNLPLLLKSLVTKTYPVVDLDYTITRRASSPDTSDVMIRAKNISNNTIPAFMVNPKISDPDSYSKIIWPNNQGESPDDLLPGSEKIVKFSVILQRDGQPPRVRQAFIWNKVTSKGEDIQPYVTKWSEVFSVDAPTDFGLEILSKRLLPNGQYELVLKVLNNSGVKVDKLWIADVQNDDLDSITQKPPLSKGVMADARVTVRVKVVPNNPSSGDPRVMAIVYIAGQVSQELSGNAKYLMFDP